MGFLDRFRPTHDEASIRRMLEGSGASAEQAEEIVQALRQRLSPDEIHVWLSDPERSHPVSDPASEEKFGVALDWTPINAVSAGKTELVIEAARRYAQTETR